MSFNRQDYLDVYRFARSVEFAVNPKVSKKLRTEAKRIAVRTTGVIGQMPDVPEGGLIGRNRAKAKS